MLTRPHQNMHIYRSEGGGELSMFEERIIEFISNMYEQQKWSEIELKLKKSR